MARSEARGVSPALFDLDWSRVHVLLTDERWVPEDHERSNTRLLRRKMNTIGEFEQFKPGCKPRQWNSSS